MQNGFEEKTEDRRIRKTKKALGAALVRLLKNKSIEEITIKELTDEADVHRGTFYHHYRDAFDLKKQVDEEIQSEIQNIMMNVPDTELSDGPYPLLVRVLLYLEENRDVAKMLCGDKSDEGILHQMCEAISGRCLDPALFGEELRYGSRFCAAGLEGMLVSWIQEGMRMPARDMAKMMENMVYQNRKDSCHDTNGRTSTTINSVIYR